MYSIESAYIYDSSYKYKEKDIDRKKGNEHDI